MRERTTTDVEKAVFKYLDILHAEGTIGIRALQRKWGFDTETAILLINLWNKNKGQDYKIIKL